MMVMDYGRECYCVCHIPISKLSTNSTFGTYIRIRCTQESPNQTTCGTCGRSGRDKYLPISDAGAREFDRLARVKRAAREHDVDEMLRVLDTVGRG